VIAVGHFFEVSSDWWQLDRAKPTIQSYRTALESALRDRGELRGCGVRCCRCGIEFLTVPANTGREDLRCPFGCRQLHRRQQSSRRGTDYYRTDAGRVKKKKLNDRRQKQTTETLAGDSSVNLQAASPQATPEVQTLQAAHAEPSTPVTPVWSLQLPGLQITEAMLEHSLVLDYVLLLFLLIARQRLTREQLLERLRQRMRQHSLLNLNRRDYVVHILHHQPP
jgi:hypothetical protein